MKLNMFYKHILCGKLVIPSRRFYILQIKLVCMYVTLHIRITLIMYSVINFNYE